MMSDSNVGLVVCQGKGKSTCSEYGKKTINLLMLMSALRLIAATGDLILKTAESLKRTLGIPSS
jgi:hypothetical protein